MWSRTMILLLVITILLCKTTRTNGNTYDATNINKTAGIYFQNIGEAKFSNQHISLVHFYNLSHIEQMIKVSEVNFRQSTSFCNIIPDVDQISCKLTMSLIEQQLVDLKFQYEDISNQHTQITKRFRRGLIDGVGYGLNWLFGLADAQDQKFYTSSIESLINDQKQTHVLMQSQIRVITDTIRNMNQTIFNLNQAEEQLNENIYKFNIFMNDSRSIINKNTVQLEIVNHLILIKQINEMIQRDLDKYTNSLSLARHGIIDYQILPPKTLLSEFSKISITFRAQMAKPRSLLQNDFP